jgi:hypothetical protein
MLECVAHIGCAIDLGKPIAAAKIVLCSCPTDRWELCVTIDKELDLTFSEPTL